MKINRGMRNVGGISSYTAKGNVSGTSPASQEARLQSVAQCGAADLRECRQGRKGALNKGLRKRDLVGVVLQRCSRL